MKTKGFKPKFIGHQNVVSFTCSDTSLVAIVSLLQKLEGLAFKSEDVVFEWKGEGFDGGYNLTNISVNGMTLDQWEKEQDRWSDIRKDAYGKK